MEQSKNARANKMLKTVITVCIIAIIAITVFTASVRRDADEKYESELGKNVTSERSTDSVTQKNVSEVPQKESKSDSSEKEKVETKVDESASTGVNIESEKENTVPTVIEEKESFDLPVNGTVIKEYSIDLPVYSVTMNDYRAHTGIDISANEGSAVGACASGIVRSVSEDPLMGTTVSIEHADGVNTYYMNLNANLPEDIIVGAVVDKGQLIGAIGNSALVEVASEPHLHLEMTVSGAYVDPLEIIDSTDISVMSENIVD